MLNAAASSISAIAVSIPNQVMTYSEDELTAGHTQALNRTFHRPGLVLSEPLWFPFS